MNLSWTHTAWKEYVEWQDIDRKMVKKINELIKECIRTPFEGIRKP
jgi:toxin YoeB